MISYDTFLDMMDIDMENVHVDMPPPNLPVPNPVSVPAPKTPKTRKHWKEEDNIKLLCQYRLGLEDHYGKEAAMAQFVYDGLVEGGIEVGTVRSVKDRYKLLIKDFRASNRIDEWKTGDPGDFTPLEQILVDIVIRENDLKKRATDGSLRKTKEQEKQQRKDQKFQFAAKHSLKNRKKENQQQNRTSAGEIDSSTTQDVSEEDEGNEPRKPARERTSYNHNINEFLSYNKTMRSRQFKMEQERLELEKDKEKRLGLEAIHRMAMEKERMELDKKREENQSLIAKALMASLEKK